MTERQTEGASEQVEAKTPWSALAWQRFGPNESRANEAWAKAVPGRRTPRSLRFHFVGPSYS